LTYAQITKIQKTYPKYLKPVFTSRSFL